jgi:hypothetical protein
MQLTSRALRCNYIPYNHILPSPFLYIYLFFTMGALQASYLGLQRGGFVT